MFASLFLTLSHFRTESSFKESNYSRRRRLRRVNIHFLDLLAFSPCILDLPADPVEFLNILNALCKLVHLLIKIFYRLYIYTDTSRSFRVRDKIARHTDALTVLRVSCREALVSFFFSFSYYFTSNVKHRAA